MKTTVKRMRTLALGTVCALVVGSCATNPATGERQLSLISESQEIQMGQEYSQQVEQTMGLYPDEDLQRYVEEIGMEMARDSERPDLPWSFGVVPDETVNAFAIPGGFIYVTRGILAHFDSEAELAAVLGHEIGHVTARHSVEQMSRTQLAQLGLGIGSIVSEEVREYGQLLGAGLQVLFLSYGRDDERQSDALGFRYMTGSGYDPHEAVDVYQMLGRQSEAAGGGNLPTWLSTHPDPESRVENIRAMIDSVSQNQLQGTEVNREGYLAQIDGIVYGKNPRHGFFQGALFVHPDLEFRMRFPEGWQTQNMNQAVVAMSPDEDAIVQLQVAGDVGPEQAARQFFSQEGIQSGSLSSTTVNGHAARSGTFQAQTQDGTLQGLAVFVELEGRTYQLLGYTPQSLQRYGSAFEESFSTFDRLTDDEALSVDPMRVELLTVERNTTIAELARERDAPVDVDRLALLNGLEQDETIPANRTIKWVAGDPPPGTESEQ